MIAKKTDISRFFIPLLLIAKLAALKYKYG